MPSRRGLLVLVLVLAGCGSTPVADERPPFAVQSSSTFRAEAKAACAELPRRLNRIPRTTSPTSDHVWVELAEAWSAAVRKLRSLEAPPAKRLQFGRMLRHFDNAIRAARVVPKVEDEMVLAPLAAMLDEGGKGATIAQSLGLVSCSAVPPAPTEQELERWRRHMLRAARQTFAQLQREPRLDQSAKPRRVRPRVEPPPRP